MKDTITCGIIETLPFLNDKGLDIIQIHLLNDLKLQSMEEKEPLEEYISAFKKLNVLLLGVFIDLVEGKEKAVFVNSNLDMIIQKPELLNQFLEFRKKVFKKYQSEIVEIFEELQKEL